ncbi:MAG: cytochrome C [Geobacteraceae bacterium]|nr:cytochrome C [Geobacteraceae bacterium]
MKYLLPVSLFLALAMVTNAGAVDMVSLSNDDCVKCHIDAVKDVDAHGAAHAYMGCQDCHFEHPPMGENVIPSCALCHDPGDSDHYTLENCVACHYPHHPLDIDFSSQSNVKPACLSCHPAQGKEMEAHPSMHAEMDCNACHMGHGLGEGDYLNCLDCHSGHSDEMVVADCTKCHRAHSPVEVTYADDLDSVLCASCHGGVAQDLKNSSKMHSGLNCAYCHAGEHKQITACADCHGATPHGETMHAKFPNCVDCHVDPHALAE